MKKIAAVCLALVLLSSCVCSLADVDFNVDAYSADELAEIYSMICVKVCGCVKVPAGFYVVGKDFPAGTYTILKNGDVEGNGSDDFAHVAIFPSMEEYNKDPNNLFNDGSLAVMACNTLWNGMSCEMTDNMVLVVKFGTVGLSKANSGIFSAFWD